MVHRSIIFTYIIGLILLVGNSFASAPEIEWGAQQGTSSEDFARDIAVDEYGNTFVVGSSECDLFGDGHGGSDGIVILNPYRFRLAMGGGLSMFDPNITQDVHLHLGGFSAEYGDKLSSVFEINTRNGNRNRVKLTGTMNLTDASGVIEGPLPGNNGSWLVSARRTYFDWIAEQMVTSNSVFPYTSDVNTKIVYDISATNRISFRWMRTDEATKLFSELSETVNLTEDSQTQLFGFSWRSYFTDKLYSNITLSYYTDGMNYHSYSADTTRENPDYERMHSDQANWSVRHNVRWQFNSNNWLTAGIHWRFQEAEIEFRSQDRNFYYARNDVPGAILFDDDFQYTAGYLESTSKVAEYLQMRIGIRYNHSSLLDNSSISPRLNIWYRLNERTVLEGSWGICHQYPDPLSLFTREQPVNITENHDQIIAEKSTQHVIGLKRQLNNDMELKCEFYYSVFDHLLLPQDNKTLQAANTGLGMAGGVEFLLQKAAAEKSRLSGIISYSYGRAKYRNIFSDRWIPFKYERAHGITLWGNYKLTPRLQVSCLWRIASGLPYTPVHGVRFTQYSSTDYSWDFVQGKRNSLYFPTYQRLDARLSYYFGRGSVYLDIINVYNHHNIYDMTWEKAEITHYGRQESVAKKRTVYMLPVLPSIGLSIQI
ncbi:SBBP repeat-containing protein [candidate division KSB1 bacterium]|nr:SBBP repeat-containing protein [candidate division KSB1 bacterium]